MDLPILLLKTEEVVQLAAEHFGLKGHAKPLAGEVDFNFYFKSFDDQEYTLKISRPNSDIQQLQLEASLLQHLIQSDFPYQLPIPIASIHGEFLVSLPKQSYLRLQKWVPGRMLGDANPRNPQLLFQWGQMAGTLSHHLSSFDHPAAHRTYKWDPCQCLSSQANKAYISNKKDREIAEYFWKLYEQKVEPLLPILRKGVNYNDAHEHNILIDSNLENPKISGLIDFGDALYTATINELAIACAYAGMHFPNPLNAMSEVIKGYHSIFPIEEKELEVLFPLISARLLITVAQAAKNKFLEPDNEYLLISEKPAWDLLRKLHKIPVNLAHYTFRNAIGITPCPKNTVFKQWLSQSNQNFANVLNLEEQKIIPLDLSIASRTLGNNLNFSTTTNFQKTISRVLEDSEADLGVGGYGETRPFYTTDAYQVEGNSGAEWRTVHLGLDFWKKEGTPVYAPLAGKIHSLKNNALDCDYGPTIILEHAVTENLAFYTLYGHLDLSSIEHLTLGETIQTGQKFASIGAPPINGNWPPHLHFQIILDLLDNDGNFPGVAFPEDVEIWKSLCPNPQFFFPTLPELPPAQEPSTLLAKRKNVLGKSLSLSYDEPLLITRGYMQYLYDHEGRRYLDTINNVAHLGHEHPATVKAGQEQMSVLNTNTRYLHPEVILFAEELLATFPPELSVVHFVNSGSEANELALRMLKTYTGSNKTIAIQVGYHGNTRATIEVSSYKFAGKGGAGTPDDTHLVPLPDVYRGPHKNPKDAGAKYAKDVEKVVNDIQKEGAQVGGFIGESILSCGGQIVLPEGYLKEVYATVRKAGGICIADEVQVGLGRAGDSFWGFELQGVIPDIVTIGKPIGNGHPLAAVVCTEEVAQRFANGMEYFNTFGGNPVSCAIGRSVLKTVLQEDLQEKAKKVGDYLIKKLKTLQKSFPIIGDVRGHGLFLGFELIKDSATLEPAAAEAHYLVNRMKQRGILMSTDGLYHNVIKIKPPMCFDQSNVDFLIDNLNLVLQEDFLLLAS